MSYLILIYSLLILFCLSLFGIMMIQKNINTELAFCLEKTSQLQSKHKKISQRLLDLNSQALNLRIQRKSAEVAVKAAPFYAKAAAKAYLEGVKILQAGLRLVQNSLLRQAQALSLKTHSELSLKGFYAQNFQYSLQVEAYPKKSDSPSYRLKKNYENLKAIEVKKVVNVFKKMPRVIQKLFKFSRRRFTLHCGAQIKQKGGKPSEIKILMGKF